ncbi:sulfotransferase 1C2-like [Haliotis asinina]|uniref:sulfotransferase 1C2-like n=1 Tax=Haliotis asinina TaxID=109174 RepID=UPI003532745D
MSRDTVEEDDGDTIWHTEHDGIRYPNSPNIDSITNIHNLPIRDDDILICAYPKSGVHWVSEMVRHLVTGHASQGSEEKKTRMTEVLPQNVTSLMSPRILRSHHNVKLLTADIFKKRCKIVYVIRNPKDVIVTLYNHARNTPQCIYQDSWERYMQYCILGKFHYGSWFDHVLEWEDLQKTHPDVPILTLHYEDIKEDPLREIRKVNEFHGSGRSTDFLREAIEVASCGNMKQTKSPSEAYRGGEVGNWKNWFTVTQNEWFDQLFQERTADSDIKVRFTL